MALPDSYLAILQRLASVCALYRGRTGNSAVLVGGAATALYTDGSFMSCDFDIVAGVDEEFIKAMLLHGFKREDRPGHLLVGFYHPDHPGYGVQQVTPPLFDGRSDPSRLVHLSLDLPGEVTLPSVEDMIADRLAQHAGASPTDTSRLNQARALYALADGPDRDYLVRRICEEDGDPALIGLPPCKGGAKA